MPGLSWSLLFGTGAVQLPLLADHSTVPGTDGWVHHALEDFLPLAPSLLGELYDSYKLTIVISKLKWFCYIFFGTNKTSYFQLYTSKSHGDDEQKLIILHRRSTSVVTSELDPRRCTYTGRVLQFLSSNSVSSEDEQGKRIDVEFIEWILKGVGT